MQLLVSLGQAISFYPQELIRKLSTPADQIAYVLPQDYQNQKFQFKLIFSNKVKISSIGSEGVSPHQY